MAKQIIFPQQQAHWRPSTNHCGCTFSFEQRLLGRLSRLASFFYGFLAVAAFASQRIATPLGPGRWRLSKQEVRQSFGVCAKKVPISCSHLLRPVLRNPKSHVSQKTPVTAVDIYMSYARYITVRCVGMCLAVLASFQHIVRPLGRKSTQENAV